MTAKVTGYGGWSWIWWLIIIGIFIWLFFGGFWW